MFVKIKITSSYDQERMRKITTDFYNLTPGEVRDFWLTGANLDKSCESAFLKSITTLMMGIADYKVDVFSGNNFGIQVKVKSVLGDSGQRAANPSPEAETSLLGLNAIHENTQTIMDNTNGIIHDTGSIVKEFAAMQAAMARMAKKIDKISDTVELLEASTSTEPSF